MGTAEILLTDDMRVAEICLQELDEKDWSLDLLKAHACFAHTKECEYILYIGDEQQISIYEQAGFSRVLIDQFLVSAQKGFKYICVYAG